jgi:DNA excision repair protein ERCC-4
MCVERKSVPDLYQSLDNGRLFQQAKAMQRCYDVPLLLIEFEKGKPFGLQDPSSIPDTVRISNVLSKLVLLCLNVRNLRLLWSENIDVTPHIFQALKDANREFGDEEPEEIIATSMGVDGTGLGHGKKDRRLDHTSVPPEMLEFLLTMSGVNRKNISDLLKVANSFEEMCNVKESDLQNAIGMEDGATLFEFLHHEG